MIVTFVQFIIYKTEVVRQLECDWTTLHGQNFAWIRLRGFRGFFYYLTIDHCFITIKRLKITKLSPTKVVLGIHFQQIMSNTITDDSQNFVEIEYLIGKKSVGKKWWIFALVTNIFYRRKFLPTKFFSDGFFTDKVSNCENCVEINCS